MTWKSYDWLNQKYNVEMMSWPEIAKLVGVSSTMVRHVAKQLAIPSRSNREAALLHNHLPLAIIRTKYESGSSIARLAAEYGVVPSVMRTNLLAAGVSLRTREVSRQLSLDLAADKLPRTVWRNREWFVEHYADHSVLELMEITGWSKTYLIETAKELNISLRSCSDAIKLKWNDDQYRHKHAEYLSNNPRVSGLQLKFYDLLVQAGIDFEPESEKTKIGYYNFDALLPASKILIDVQGTYFHSKKAAISRDRQKFDYINNYHPDYRIVYVWESDINDCPELVVRNLQLRINTPPLADFRFEDVTVAPVGFEECKSFLDAYHYIGGNRGGLAVGAKLGKEMVGAVVYAPPLRQNLSGCYGTDGFLELSRLCVAPTRHKPNFASWLIARSLRHVDAPLVVAYADKTAGHCGGVYRAANFQLHHEIKPDYWYVNDDGYVLHKKTLYNRAVRSQLREAEYAVKFGYRKQFGLPKLAFVFRR